jgi:Phosphodiester glycosidase
VAGQRQKIKDFDAFHCHPNHLLKMHHKQIGNRLNAAIIALFLGLFLSACSSVPKSHTAHSPVSYEHIVHKNPNLSIYVVKINLASPCVSVRVSRGGPDPDGNGPWVTTLMRPSEVAARDHYDIAINGDFFVVPNTKDIEGKNTGYVEGKFAAPEGTAMTDGHIWHYARRSRPYLEITSANTAAIVRGRLHQPIDPAARQIVGGGQIIVQNGKAVEYDNAFATRRNPRTAVGISHHGKELTLLVVDGRQPALSIGMTLAELSHEMLQLGCENAINLDGGGSSTLVYREPTTHEPTVLNSPSDTRERSVAEVLGIKVRTDLPATN